MRFGLAICIHEATDGLVTGTGCVQTLPVDLQLESWAGGGRKSGESARGWSVEDGRTTKERAMARSAVSAWNVGKGKRRTGLELVAYLFVRGCFRSKSTDSDKCGRKGGQTTRCQHVLHVESGQVRWTNEWLSQSLLERFEKRLASVTMQIARTEPRVKVNGKISVILRLNWTGRSLPLSSPYLPYLPDHSWLRNTPPFDLKRATIKVTQSFESFHNHKN
jgi:hypothetical protein